MGAGPVIAAHKYGEGIEQIVEADSIRFTLSNGDEFDVRIDNAGNGLRVSNTGRSYASGLRITPHAANVVTIGAAE